MELKWRITWVNRDSIEAHGNSQDNLASISPTKVTLSVCWSFNYPYCENVYILTFCLFSDMGGKVVPVHHAMKTYWGCGGIAPHIIALAVDGGEWLVSRPGHFIPRVRVPGTHWVGGWVGPRAGLDAALKRKNPQPPPGIEP
jgi:hypothetical protein